MFGGSELMRAALPHSSKMGIAVVRCLAPSNITLSGLQTLDGIALADKDLVLVNNQTDLTQNAVYRARATAWKKLGQVPAVCVSLGTQYADTLWFLATSPANTYLQLQTGGGTTVVKAASTAAVTLNGPQTVDGQACASPDKVLVKDNGAANGVYLVQAGAWKLLSQPTSVSVVNGTVNRALNFFLSAANTYTPTVGVYG